MNPGGPRPSGFFCLEAQCRCVPLGTHEMTTDAGGKALQPSLRDGHSFAPNPALKRRANFSRPCGTSMRALSGTQPMEIYRSRRDSENSPPLQWRVVYAEEVRVP
jgi:hypothetical protein